MNKKFKKLLTAGLVTVITGTSAVQSSALCKKTINTYKTKGVVYLYINGKKYQLSLGCNNKPSQDEDSSTEDNNSSNTDNDNNQDNNDSNMGNDNNQDNNDSNIGNDNDQNNDDSNIGNDNNQDNSDTSTGNDSNQENNDNNSESDGNENNNDSNIDNDNDQNDNDINAGNENDNTSNDNQNTSGSFLSFQEEVVRLVNVERTKRGLSELSFNTQLSNVATLKSQDMINKNYFSHTSPTYGSPFDMMKQFNISYKTAGENIAKGQKTPEEVVNAWMNSQGHRENILSTNFTDIGVGVAKSSDGTLYWTQMFIGK